MHFCEICIVKFTLHTFIKMHLLFCSINSKSKWYYGTPCMLELTALLFRRQGNTLRTKLRQGSGTFNFLLEKNYSDFEIT